MSKLLKAKEELLTLTPGLSYSSDSSLLEGLERISKLSKYRSPLLDDLRLLIEDKNAKIISFLDENLKILEREILLLDKDYSLHSDNWVDSLRNHSHEEWQQYMNKMYDYGNESKQWTIDRISAYSNWQKIALFYMPDTLDYIEQFSSYYPIYVLDKWRQTADLIKDLVPPEQARKTRFYNTDQLEQVPLNCMGFILARNYYTHKKHNHLENDLKFFSQVLRSGGVLCFNFNNCEISNCAGAVENKTRSYMIGTTVKRLLWENNFEIVRWEYLNFENTMWVEAQKPGKFKSIRRNEALGKIEELPAVRRLRELREKYVGLNDDQLKSIMQREGNID